MQEKLGAILSTIDETLGGIRIIKAFNAEKKQFKKLSNQNDELFIIKNRANISEIQLRLLLKCWRLLPLYVCFGMVEGWCLGNTFLDPGDFLAYIVIFSQVIQPLKSLSSASYNIKKGAASIERIEHLINENV